MTDRKRTRVIAAVVIGLMLVAALAAACQTAPVSPVQVEITNWDQAGPLAGNFGSAGSASTGSATDEASRSAGNTEVLRGLRVLNDAVVGGALEVGGDLTVGTDGRYPVENAAANQIYEFGATGAISTTVVTPVAITTVTAYGCQVVNPAIAAWHCGVNIGASNNITLTVYNLSATPVATPKAATFWIAGD